MSSGVTHILFFLLRYHFNSCIEVLLMPVWHIRSPVRLHGVVLNSSTRLRESRIWDSKTWSRIPRDSEPRVTALARASSNCKWQTHPLVPEGAPHQQTRNCLTVTKIWYCAADGCLTPRQTGRLNVSRNITLTMSCSFSVGWWVS
jgi:hypothetical protein